MGRTIQDIKIMTAFLFLFLLPSVAVAEEALPITVLRPLEFEDLTIEGVQTSVDIEALSNKAVKTGDPEGKGVSMCDYSVEPK
ncbi:MAG: hypothetical protein AB7E52_01235 [Bdellovibrionales bacterium]